MDLCDQVASLACVRNQSLTLMHKLEQVYAYFSTAGEDTRIFGFGATAAVKKSVQDSVGGIPIGARMLHSTHGYGVVTHISMGDERGKPVVVEFHNGEVHQYSLDSANKLKVLAGESSRRGSHRETPSQALPSPQATHPKPQDPQLAHATEVELSVIMTSAAIGESAAPIGTEAISSPLPAVFAVDPHKSESAMEPSAVVGVPEVVDKTEIAFGTNLYWHDSLGGVSVRSSQRPYATFHWLGESLSV
jgi:hypothetical protein